MVASINLLSKSPPRLAIIENHFDSVIVSMLTLVQFVTVDSAGAPGVAMLRDLAVSEM